MSAPPTASASIAASATPSIAASPASPTSTPTSAVGGIEAWATDLLHGTYAWVMREQFATTDVVTYTLLLVPTDGGAARPAVRFTRARGALPIILARQLSADGRKLALEQPGIGPAAHDGFVVIDLRRGQISELARFDARVDLMPAWSPDGTRIAFARGIPNATPVSADDGLWLINADGSGLRRLLPAAQFAQRTNVFGWTADGRGIAYGLSFEGLTFSVVSADDGSALGPSTGFAFGLAPASWRLRSPQFVGAFSEGDKGGEQRIVLADGPGRPLRTLFSEKQAVLGDVVFLNARWHPTSDQLLYIRSSRRSQIMRLALDGSPSVEVPTTMSPSQAEWLPDGRIAYVGNANGIGSVVRVTDGTKDLPLLDFLSEGGASFASLAIRSYP